MIRTSERQVTDALLTDSVRTMSVRKGRQAATSSTDTSLRGGPPPVRLSAPNPPGRVRPAVGRRLDGRTLAPAPRRGGWFCVSGRVTRLKAGLPAGVRLLVLVSGCFVLFYFLSPTPPTIPCTRAIFQSTHAILHPPGAGHRRLSAHFRRHALKFGRSLLNPAPGLPTHATFSPVIAPCPSAFARVGGKISRVGGKIARVSAAIARDSSMIAPPVATLARVSSAIAPRVGVFVRDAAGA